MKQIQTSGAQNRHKKRLRETEDNAMRGSFDVWEKKHYVAKNQLGTENHEPVTVVQDGVSNPVYTELKIGGDNQDENSSQKSIPEDVDDFAEVSANVEAIAVTLNDEAEDNKNNQDFFELFHDHDFGRLRKPIFIHLVKCLVQQGPENFHHKKDSFFKKKGRSLSKHWFEWRAFGGRLRRKWLLYSPCKQAAFCVVCFVFSRCKSSFCNEDGFSSWRKLNPRIYEHERSPGYRNAMHEYLDFAARLEKLRVIDYELQKPYCK